MRNDSEQTPAEFWDHHYTSVRTGSSGRPSRVLRQFAADLTPGRSLDLGCAHGDDVFWLARRGWLATGADISATVIERANRRRVELGLESSVRFERHDLAQSFPAGEFDLVTAFFLLSPKTFDRVAVLRRASEAVSPGGLLLITTHASVPPWSWADPDTRFDTPEEAHAGLGLSETTWHPEYVGAPERRMEGPGGQTAMVRDTILAIRRVSA